MEPGRWCGTCDSTQNRECCAPSWVSRERAEAEETLRAAGGEASVLARYAGGVGGTGFVSYFTDATTLVFGSSDLPLETSLLSNWQLVASLLLNSWDAPDSPHRE